MSYVDIDVPEKLQTKIIDLLKEVSEKSSNIKRGMNETTKAIERGIAKLVIIAGDVSPPEIVMHLPKIAEEKKIAYGFLNEKISVGKAIGINVPCAAIAVVGYPTKSKDELDSIVDDLTKLKN
jgi:large subunit ribosomal protein L7Ae